MTHVECPLSIRCQGSKRRRPTWPRRGVGLMHAPSLDDTHREIRVDPQRRGSCARVALRELATSHAQAQTLLSLGSSSRSERLYSLRPRYSSSEFSRDHFKGRLSHPKRSQRLRRRRGADVAQAGIGKGIQAPLPVGLNQQSCGLAPACVDTATWRNIPNRSTAGVATEPPRSQPVKQARGDN